MVGLLHLCVVLMFFGEGRHYGLREDFARRGEEGDASATEARREGNQRDDPGGTDDGPQRGG